MKPPRLTHFASVVLFSLLLAACGATKPQTTGKGRLHDLGNGICLDTGSSLMWQIDKGPRKKSDSGARAYVENLELGGFRDWRLPTTRELYELMYYLDLHKETECSMDLPGSYWSTDEKNEETAGAWEVAATCDPEREYEPKPSGFVRAVRSAGKQEQGN